MKNKINENNLSMYKNKIFYLSFLFKEISKQCKSIILSSMNINDYNSTTHQYSVHCHPTYNPKSMSSDNFQQGSGMFVHILLGCPSIHWHLKKRENNGILFQEFSPYKIFCDQLCQNDSDTFCLRLFGIYPTLFFKIW